MANPFGDDKLTERFVWRKKIEKSLMDGVDPKDLGLTAEKRRHEQRLLEIEKVKKQREQREVEKMEKELEREVLQREEALIEAVELEKKEEEFHVLQAKMRSDMRVEQGRARAVDLIARNVECEVGVETSARFDFKINPIHVFLGLTTNELHELKDDVLVRLDLTKHDLEKHAFWRDFITVCDDELANARRRDAVDRARVRGKDASAASAQARDVIDQGLHEQVENDVAEMLVGKSRLELEGLEREVADTLSDPHAPELEYWQAVLRRISVSKARAAVVDADLRMKERHEPHRPRFAPPAPGAGTETDSDEDLLGADFGTNGVSAGGAVSGDGDDLEPPGSPDHAAPASPQGFTPEGTPDREYSPVLLDAVPGYVSVLDPNEDLIAVAELREKARQMKMGRFAEANRMATIRDASGTNSGYGDVDTPATGTYSRAGNVNARAYASGNVVSNIPGASDPDGMIADDEVFTQAAKSIADRMMGANDGAEVAFAGEAQLEQTAYWWHDKFRPRYGLARFPNPADCLLPHLE